MSWWETFDIKTLAQPMSYFSLTLDLLPSKCLIVFKSQEIINDLSRLIKDPLLVCLRLLFENLHPFILQAKAVDD